MQEHTLENEIFIRRPPAAVYGYVTQPWRWHEWHPASESATPSPHALVAGDHFEEEVMHHLRPGLRMVYERHSKQHQRFFTEREMAFESSRDFKVVLFPPVLVTFFLLVFGTPVAFLLAWLMTPNVGYLFALMATAYFLNYELLHFVYHLPPDHVVYRLPGMRVLRRLHTAHHDQALMAHHNFNISYPLMDWVFGTLHSGKK